MLQLTKERTIKINRLLSIPALLLLSATVYAGYAQPSPVIIELFEGAGSAQGDMLTARNIDNDDTFIGCGQRLVEVGGSQVFTFGFCQAAVEVDFSYTSFTENAALMKSMDIASDSSFITFSWTDDGEGNLTCTRIGASTQSFYLEKGKKIKAKDLD